MIIFRRSRLGAFIRVSIFLGLSILIPLYTPNARYGLLESTPTEIKDLSATDSLEKYLDAYISLPGTPDSGEMIAHMRYGITYYWAPLKDYGGRVLVRVLDSQSLERGSAAGAATLYQGKFSRIDKVAFNRDIRGLFNSKYGIDVADDTYVILADEQPDAYRYVVVLYALMLLCWFLLAFYFGYSFVRRMRTKS